MAKKTTQALKLVFSPLYFYVAYALCRACAISLISTFALAALGVIGSGVALGWVRYTRSGRSAAERSQTASWSGTVITTIGLASISIAGFTSLSVGLYRLGVGSVKGKPHDANIVTDAFASYLYHLANAVPLLKIPSTLNWSLDHPFTDHIQGALSIAFTVIAILPVIYLLTKWIQGITKDPTVASGSEEDGEAETQEQ